MRAQSAVTSFRVFPRSSAAKKHTHPRFLFRVFRGESWFPVANTVIEQSHSQLARAKAHATVFGPRNPRSRHSAFFRVFPRPKERHTHARKTTCSATHRSQHSRLRFQRPLKPRHLRSLFRVFRDERWFPVENTVIEQSHSQLARA